MKGIWNVDHTQAQLNEPVSMAAVTPEPVGVVVEAPLGIIRPRRAPRRRNPLSAATMTALTSALRELENDDVRVVIVRAHGPAFSAGHDLAELRDRTLEDERAVFDTCVEMMTAVHELDRPVIAEVAGAAFAAGCQLVATCDLAIASTEATFSTPGVRIGLFCSARWWRSPGRWVANVR